MTVYLPPGYDAERARRYPVLYLHDGQNLFSANAPYGGWAVQHTADRLLAAGRIEPVIVVGVESHGPRRMWDLTSCDDRRYGYRGGGAEAYLDFLEHDLKPWVDARYRTRAGPEDTAIGGSSLGGLVSLHAGLTRAHCFRRILAMSPSLWWNRHELEGRVRRAAELPPIAVYLDNGNFEDGRRGAERFRDLLQRKGLGYGERLWHWTEPAAEHTEAAWRERLWRGLEALFPPR